MDGAVVVPRDTTTAGVLLSKDEVSALARDESSELAHSSAPMATFPQPKWIAADGLDAT